MTFEHAVAVSGQPARGLSDVSVIRGATQAAMLLDPSRLRMLEVLGEPDSAAGVARRLELPRQRVNYHLRELEKAGLLECVGERRRRNCTERLMRTVARAYVISPEVLGVLGADPASLQDRLSSTYLLAAAAKLVRDVADLRGKADEAGKRLPTLTLETELAFASAADRNGFAEDLAAALTGLVEKYHSPSAPGARWVRVLTACHPSMTPPDAAPAREPSASGSSAAAASAAAASE